MEHRDVRSLEALEQQVPDPLVEGMWQDVQGALRARRPGSQRSGGSRRWVVPALAAAAVVLVLANGLTLRALQRAEARQVSLTGQILDQQRRLAELEAPEEGGVPAPVGRRSALMGREAWVRSIESGAPLTVAALRELLGRIPPETPLISPARAGRLASSRLVPSLWRDAFALVDPATGVTAQELLGILDHLDLPDGASVPAARLMDLLS